MSLKPGRYRIRYAPPALRPPFVGGLYAISTDIGEPILAEPESPEHPSQVWEVHINEHGKYIITKPGFRSKLSGIGPVLPGWSLSSPSKEHPGGTILLGVNYTEFEIEPSKSGDCLVYGVRVPNVEDTHGHFVQFYVAERNHDVISQAYWPQISLRRPHPNWEFIPADEN